MSDQPPQDIHNEQPNQGTQGTFHGPVSTGPQVNQQGQTVHGNQTNIAGGVHYHGEPPLQFARPIPPAPPEDFVPRPHEFNQLLAHLCSSDSVPVAITAALAGAGGFGKTTLAKAICHDERVKAAFEGVLWVEVGQEPGNLIGKVEDLVLQHHLRSRSGYEQLVQQHNTVTGTTDRRDIIAITRLAAGFCKLLFPHGEVTAGDFREYCLKPAVELRQNVRDQLSLLDPEYTRVRMGW